MTEMFSTAELKDTLKILLCKSTFVTVIAKHTSLFNVSYTINSEQEVNLTSSSQNSLREAEGQGGKGDSSMVFIC